MSAIVCGACEASIDIAVMKDIMEDVSICPFCGSDLNTRDKSDNWPMDRFCDD